MMGRFIGTAEIQRVLSVGRTKAYEIIKQMEKAGKAYKFGRLLRVKEEDFAKWVNQHEL